MTRFDATRAIVGLAFASERIARRSRRQVADMARAGERSFDVADLTVRAKTQRPRAAFP